jgi:hypothetical protein
MAAAALPVNAAQQHLEQAGGNLRLALQRSGAQLQGPQ